MFHSYIYMRTCLEIRQSAFLFADIPLDVPTRPRYIGRRDVQFASEKQKNDANHNIQTGYDFR